MKRSHYLRSWPKWHRSELDGLPWIAYVVATVLGLVVPWVWNTWRG